MQLNTALVMILGSSHVELWGEQLSTTLKDMRSFKKQIGGSGATIAMGCARLGLKTTLVSQVGDDPLGTYVQETLAQQGVDVSQLKRVNAPTALVLRASLQTETAPYSLHHTFNAELEHCQALLITSDYLHKNPVTTQKIISQAQAQLIPLILVIEENVPSLEILSQFDVIISHAQALYALSATSQAELCLSKLRDLTQGLIILSTAEDLFVSDKTHPYFSLKLTHPHSQRIDITTIGFLFGYLQKHPLEKSAQFANRYLALYAQTHLLPKLETFSLYSSGQNQALALSQSAYFSRLQYLKPAQQQLFALNLGDPTQWQRLHQTFTQEITTINQAKFLIAQGVKQIAHLLTGTGLVIDHSINHEVIDLFSSSQAWLGRTVALPKTLPLQFIHPDITQTLISWPSHHLVNVGVTYHPDDRYPLRSQQEASLKLLYHACQITQHRLLIEISPPTNSLVTASTLAHIMQRFYEMGIYPDWWQIRTPRDPRSWENMQKIIENYDPHCSGIVLQTPLIHLDPLTCLFKNTPSLVKGFMVDSTFFQPLIELWLRHKLSDQQLVNQIANQLEQVIHLWLNRTLIKEKS